MPREQAQQTQPVPPAYATGEPAGIQQRRAAHSASLVGAVMQLEPLTDRILRWLPEWVRDVFQDRRKSLLYLERRVQRRLINEFRAQARELEPVLKSRGRMVGETIVEVFTSSSGTDVTYAEVVAASLPDTVAEKLPRDLVTVIDPLITPFISPFVEGLKLPINDKATEIKTTVVQSFVATGAACLVAGFLLGRYLPRGGGGGSSSGGGANGSSSKGSSNGWGGARR